MVERKPLAATKQTPSQSGRILSPNSCAACGIDSREHARRWKPPVGWHAWIQPSPALIKERMLARHQARTTRS